MNLALALAEQEKERLKAFLDGEQKERSRIGRELHDGIGAMLFTISHQLKTYFNKNEHGDKEALNRLIALVNETTVELKNTVHSLIPETIALKGLEESLTTYCSLISRDHRPVIQLNCYGNWESVEVPVVHTVFRMAQELIRNIIMHSGAAYAAVTLSCFDSCIRLFVEDDGKGFDTSHIRYGSGLHNLHARASLLKADISIESVPGKGTTCIIIINL